MGAAPPELAEAAKDLQAAEAAYNAEVAIQWSASEATQRELRSGLEAMFEGACTALLAACTALQELEMENARMEANRCGTPVLLCIALFYCLYCLVVLPFMGWRWRTLARKQTCVILLCCPVLLCCTALPGLEVETT